MHGLQNPRCMDLNGDVFEVRGPVPEANGSSTAEAAFVRWYCAAIGDKVAFSVKATNLTRVLARSQRLDL